MNQNNFAFRHNGPNDDDIQKMLNKIGVKTLDELIGLTIPSDIRFKEEVNLKPGIDEAEYFEKIKTISSRNKLFKTYIGMGYYGTVMPAVIQRNILENPAWYTSYTPYQAEISQGRLEALLNFQTVILELTGMEIANASLLDEGTAAAEAMIMMYNSRTKEQINSASNRFFIDQNIFPQTLDVIKTRANCLGIETVTCNINKLTDHSRGFGVIVQYPAGDGKIINYKNVADKAHSLNIPVAVISDILSLVLLNSPVKWGADVVVGSSQRFGIPINYGGPHAAFFATKEVFKRNIPGRIIGVTIDRDNRPSLRMALQTREQHIKRERATSNICTAQALLAIMAGMYAVYHGSEGLKAIALKIHKMAVSLRDKLVALGCAELNLNYFDTLRIKLPDGVSSKNLNKIALEKNINFRYFDDDTIGISLDETTAISDLNSIVDVFSLSIKKPFVQITSIDNIVVSIGKDFMRNDNYMNLELFKRYRSETEIMRYIKLLERKDYSLVHGMIPLGSCTMKLNAAIEMLPLSWPEFGNIHPFVPIDQAEGYHQIFNELGEFLKILTGFKGISFQPNSGAAGEYAGLLVIRKYHESRNQNQRNIVLIPSSAHGTNPASATMAGLKVVVVNCDEKGNIDMIDLESKAGMYSNNLAAFMVTYPSTHGVFESGIKKMAEIIHTFGGQVYMDGANMNAQVGLTSPSEIGADVCHLNLHKTFAIPHGGGGPGVGPILVADHLIQFLPSHSVINVSENRIVSAVSSAPWGSAGILCISHAYCCLLGKEGLAYSTKIAILNANYLAACLKDFYKILYTGENGFVAHEMILDCRSFKQISDVSETDIAKRLMDYGFHAPTLSFPVHGTLMVEPTESEPLNELDRFINALISIYKEIITISENGNKTDNLLKNAPHTQLIIVSENWDHPYSRKEAAFPDKWTERNKFWPSISRVDDAYGDRNLVCSCATIDTYR